MYSLKNKTVLITGGAKGIGAAIATEALKEGIKHVRILDMDKKAGIQLQNQLNNTFGKNKAKFVKCNVTNEKKLFKAIDDINKEMGYLDVIVNNAGVGCETNYTAIRKVIETNYSGNRNTCDNAQDRRTERQRGLSNRVPVQIATVNGTLKAMEIMNKTKGGSGGTVMNISSIAGLLPILPEMFTYSSTKSAVLQFTSCIGSESHFKETGVRVIALCYGVTDTAIVGALDRFGGNNKPVFDIMNSHEKQSVEAAAIGAIVAYQNGISASTWLIKDGKPAVDITDSRQKCDQEMARVVSN